MNTKIISTVISNPIEQLAHIFAPGAVIYDAEAAVLDALFQNANPEMYQLLEKLLYDWVAYPIMKPQVMKPQASPKAILTLRHLSPFKGLTYHGLIRKGWDNQQYNASDDWSFTLTDQTGEEHSIMVEFRSPNYHNSNKNVNPLAKVLVGKRLETLLPLLIRYGVETLTLRDDYDNHTSWSDPGYIPNDPDNMGEIYSSAQNSWEMTINAIIRKPLKEILTLIQETEAFRRNMHRPNPSMTDEAFAELTFVIKALSGKSPLIKGIGQLILDALGLQAADLLPTTKKAPTTD